MNYRAFHEVVDIFGRRAFEERRVVPYAPFQIIERQERIVHFRGGEDADGLQRFGPGAIDGDLVGQQTTVERERTLERVELFVRLALEAAAQPRSKPACAADRFCLAGAQRCCAPTVLIAAGLGFLLWADGYREREKIDEAFGVFGIVAAHGEAGEVGAIEGERRDALGYGERAFPKF